MFILLLLTFYKEILFKPPPQLKYFTVLSKAVLLLWIIYVIFVLYLLCVCAPLFIVALWSLLGHLGSLLRCLIVNLSLSHWYPGSGVVLDCVSIPGLSPLCYF